MTTLQSVVREGSKILRRKSLHEQRSQFERWRSLARTTTNGLPIRNRLRLSFSSLDRDLRILKTHLEHKQKRNTAARKNKSVFVVIGRHRRLQDDIFNFLRAVGLAPLEWQQALRLATTPTPFIGEVLDRAFDKAQAIVVVFSGDDEARLRKPFLRTRDASFERMLTPQPRPNVIFEAGMAFGRHPTRTIVLEIGTIRPLSDLSGRHFVRMDSTPRARNELIARLKKAKCVMDLSGSDWLEVGNFEP
jgi:predicted nucleotide-binding protein